MPDTTPGYKIKGPTVQVYRNSCSKVPKKRSIGAATTNTSLAADDGDAISKAVALTSKILQEIIISFLTWTGVPTTKYWND